MDSFRAIKTVLDIIKIPIDLAREDKRLGRKLKNGLQNLKYDLDVMKEDLKSYQELQLLELVCDIEDFVLGLWIPEASGPALSAFALDPREGYLDRIESFQKRLERLEKRHEKSTDSRSERGGGCSADAYRGDETASSSAAREESLVGIVEHKNLLLDLIHPASTRSRDQASGQPPKVISIVGCPGVGKTTLARAVYHYYRDSDDFNCVAWVEALECNNKTALLSKIIQKVQADLARRAAPTPVPSEGDGNAASSDLHGILADKRYLVFIDNMKQAEVCCDIQNDFPQNGKSNMLIVTTSDHSVINVFSSRSYVYTMQRLPPKESEKLFWESVGSSGGDPPPALRNSSQSILNKCDGLPLALISVAKYLRITRGTQLNANDCVMVGKELGRHLVGGESELGFRELRRALGQCYDGLPQPDYKSCMLYLSIFPRNHPIKRKGLVRRLIAEGLVANSDPKTLDELIRVMYHGQKCLEGLVNRCIVEPVQVCSCSKYTKSCPVNGVMLEFIIHKSQSTNLVTLLRKEEVVRNTNAHIRRLSVQSSTKDKFDEVARKVGLSVIRSLTIFSSNIFVPSSSKKNLSNSLKKGSELFNLKKCKFLRLLHLDDCKGLDEEVLNGICALVYLKYLSLRKTDVKKIPRKIEKLRCLQTLDIRETREIQLPIEAIRLPKLAFLFGQFVLPQMSNDTKQFLSTRSELHTLAGFVLDKAGRSEQIILEARNLRKVEVWYKDACVSSNPQTSTTQDFVSSLQKHLTSLDSLSIHSSQLSQDILATLEKAPCKISSMKLWGKLDKLPGVATLSMLNTLSKLQLFYTGLTSDDLSILQHMSCLEYLKLQDNQNDSWDGSFSVLKDGFESLRRLCFQASKLPKLQFDTESMKSLTSLHLLCPDISQMQVAEEISKSIEHITSLNEVILHSSATRETVEAWEMAAKNNANRPRVNQLQEQ